MVELICDFISVLLQITNHTAYMYLDRCLYMYICYTGIHHNFFTCPFLNKRHIKAIVGVPLRLPDQMGPGD